MNRFITAIAGSALLAVAIATGPASAQVMYVNPGYTSYYNYPYTTYYSVPSYTTYRNWSPSWTSSYYAPNWQYSTPYYAPSATSYYYYPSTWQSAPVWGYPTMYYRW